MIRANFGFLIRIIGFWVLLFSALTTHAEDENKTTVKWRAVGIISGQAFPFTTAAYFPRPLVAGELVTMTFTINTSAAGTIFGTYASYEGALKSVKVTGSDWSINMRSPLGRGVIAIANDDPDYGDSLSLVATSPLVPQKTWYDVELDLSNPGGPNPGTGPWAPFTSLALPKSPPSLGLMPGNVFYIQARRDQPGQELDGASYYGQILSIIAVKCDD